jgi:hypothetical protein
VIRRLTTLLLLLVPAASAEAADTTIATTTTSQVVSAHAGRLAWSEGEKLMTWANGIASEVPVAPQAGGFDVDLGRGPGGATVAVYSRDDGLYLFDFAAGTERRLSKLSRPGVREQGPVIDRDRIVFFRGTATRRGLSVGTIATGRIRAIPKLPREIGPYDFAGDRLAYSQGTFAADRSLDRLYVHDVRTGKRRELDRLASGSLSSARFAGVTIRGNSLYVAKVRFGAAGNRFARIDLRTRRAKEIRGRTGILEAAFDGGRAFYLKAGGEVECEPCSLQLTPALGL